MDNLPPLGEVLTYHSFIAFLFGSFISLVTITNPASKVPMFISLTDRLSPRARRRTASKACWYAFVILTISLFAGGLILQWFGISYGALRVAGGLVIAIIGYRMLFRTESDRYTPHAHRINVAFFPLAMPGIGGPGAIAVVIGLSTEIAELKTALHKTLAYSATVLSIFVACVVVWLTLHFAERISRALGVEGTEVLTRLMGFLLICIGVQFVASGVHTLVIAA